ncbi:MAG: hypothetical protein CMD81_10935 [Gammaproteobacteria bacterium]|nr:hypothetical protein [Gammaproteobacteria bacterium]|tara:strand:- start:13100 stop:19546 length:6447 start_codon:yes stop_codon:yes gene_type:complete
MPSNKISNLHYNHTQPAAFSRPQAQPLQPAPAGNKLAPSTEKVISTLKQICRAHHTSIACSVIDEYLKTMPADKQYSHTEMTHACQAIEKLVHETCLHIDAEGLEALSEIHGYLLEHPPEILNLPTADILAGLNAEPQELQAYLAKDQRLLQPHQKPNTYFDTLYISDIIDRQSPHSTHDLLTPVLTFETFDKSIIKNWGLADTMALKWLHTNVEAEAETYKAFIQTALQHGSKTSRDHILSSLLLLSQASDLFSSPNKAQIQKETLRLFNEYKYNWKNISPYVKLDTNGYWQRNKQHQDVFLSTLILNLVSTADLKNITSTFKQNIQDAFEKAEGSRQRFLFMANMMSKIIKPHLHTQFLKGMQQLIPQQKAQQEELSALRKYTAQSHQGFPFMLYCATHKVNAPAQHLQSIQKKIDFFAWQDIKKTAHSLGIETNEIANPLLHQTHLLLSKGNALDIELNPKFRANFIHQLASKYALVCIDSSESLHWLQQPKNAPGSVKNILDNGGLILLDEAQFSPQELESLNELKEGNRLNGHKLAHVVQVISFINTEIVRSSALSSRAIPLKESQLKFVEKYDHIKVKALSSKNAVVLKTNEPEALYHWIDKPDKTQKVIISKQAEETTLAEMHVLSKAHQLQIPVEYAPLQKQAQAIIFADNRIRTTGHIVTEDTFSQNLEWQIKLKQGQLVKQKGPLQTGLNAPVYCLDSLSSTQKEKLARAQVPIYQLPAQTIDEADLAQLPTRLTPTHKVSLDYISHEIKPQDLFRLQIQPNHVIWITPDDSYEDLTVKLKQQKNSKGQVFYTQQEGALLHHFKTQQKTVLIGLEKNPALQQQLLSLFMPKPYLNIFGEIYPLEKIAPNQEIRCIVSAPLAQVPSAHYHSQLPALREAQNDYWPGFNDLSQEQKRAWIPYGHPWEQEHNLDVTLIDRKEVTLKIAEAFIKEKALLLLGSASAGKTTLLQQFTKRDQLFSTNAGVWNSTRFNNTLHSWASSTPINNKRLVLFIDEATLQKDWTQFKGFFTQQPNIRIENKTYQLTPAHKLVLAGNFPNMPGRHYIPLLAENAQCFHIPQLTLKELQQGIINPLLNTMAQANPAFKVKLRDFLQHTHLTASFVLGDEVATPRQLKAITHYATTLLCRPQSQISQGLAANHLSRYICDLYKGLADTQEKETFFSKLDHQLMLRLDEFFPTKNGQLQIIHTPELATTKAVKSIKYNLTELMAVRKSMIDLIPKGSKSPAPQAFIIQGEPGTGKDETLKQFFKDDPHFIHINANQNIEEITDKFIFAAKHGYIIAISEANTLQSATLESITNDLFTGDMPDGTKVHPGFMAIFTINNTSLEGREAISDALKSRCITLKLPLQDSDDNHELVLFNTTRPTSIEYPSIFNTTSISPTHAGIYDNWLMSAPISARTLNRRIREHAQGISADVVNRWFDTTSHEKPVENTISFDEAFFDVEASLKPNNYDDIESNADSILYFLKLEPQSELVKATEILPYQWDIVTPAKTSTTPTLANITAKRDDTSASIATQVSTAPMGQIQHLHENKEIQLKARYLTQTRHNDLGELKLTHAPGLLTKTCIPEYSSIISIHTATAFGIASKYKGQAYLAWTLAVPQQFAPQRNLLNLSLSGAHGRLTTSIDGILEQTQANDCVALFKHADILSLESQLSGLGYQNWDNVTLNYSVAPVTDQLIDEQQKHSSTYTKEDLERLYNELPETVQEFLFNINTASALGSADQIAHEIQKSIAYLKQIHQYPMQADEYLDSLYHVASDDYLKRQEHIALTLLKEQKGRCTHGAHTWCWLINTFTQHSANFVSGLFAENKIPSDGHSWIEVNIHNINFTFDPTPIGILSPKAIETNQDIIDELVTSIEAENLHLNLNTHLVSESGTTTKQVHEEAKSPRFSFAPESQITASKKRKKETLADYIAKLEHKPITPTVSEKQSILTSDWVKSLSRKQLGKGYMLASEGHIIDVNMIDKNTDKIFKKPYLNTQDTYKKIIFTEFKPNQDFTLSEAMALQSLLNSGIDILINQNGKLTPIQNVKELYSKPVRLATDIPYSLQGSQSHIIDSNDANYKTFIQETYNRLFALKEPQEQYQLIARHFRPWLLNDFPESLLFFNRTMHSIQAGKINKPTPLVNINGLIITDKAMATALNLE